jgi:DNA-binding CsgD family transcriptional regulator
MIYRIIFILLFVLKTQLSLASDLLSLKNNIEITPITLDYIDYIEDPIGSIIPSEIIKGVYDKKFQPLKKNIGISPYTYWLKLRVKNDSEEKLRILELEYPPFEYISVYLPSDQGTYTEKKSGAALPFSTRDIKVHTHAFKFFFKSNEEKIIYIKIKSAAVKLPMKFMSEDIFYQHITSSIMFFSLITGIFIVIILINIFLFVKFVNYTNLLYSIYIIALLMTLLTDGGLTYQYLWSPFQWWNAKSFSFLILSVAVTHIFFALSLLNLRRYSLPFYRFCRFVAILYSAIGISILFIPNWISFKIAIIALLLLFGLGASAIYIAYRHGDKPVRFYAIGWISLITIVGMSFLKYLGNEPYILGINYASSIACVVEIIFFAIAIGVSVKQFIEERLLLEKEIQQSPLQESELTPLTEREKEVLELISKGYSDKEIAQKMFLSTHTIKSHAKNLYHKLGVKNRIQATNRYKNPIS